MATYLTQSDADALAATMVASQVSAYVAATSAQKTAALEAATLRIDSAVRYQGEKYDPAQALEFPRNPYPSQSLGQPISWPPYPPSSPAGLTIWDWDADNNVAIVPDRVKRACLLEANSILEGSRDAALDAVAGGVKSESVGSAAKTYISPGELKDTPGATSPLCRLAFQLLEIYRLRSGAMR